MNRWRLFIEAMTGRDSHRIHDHERRLSNLEAKVAVIEGLDAFRRMVGEDDR